MGPSHTFPQLGLVVPEYAAVATKDVVVIVRIETPQRVENLDDILSVAGIELLFSGPADLAVAMGGRVAAEG